MQFVVDLCPEEFHKHPHVTHSTKSFILHVAVSVSVYGS